MKEKIFLALKLACGQTTSISDRTLETLAASLSANITEETQITAAIELQKPFLQELDGNINFVAAKAAKAVVQPVIPPEVPVKTTVDAEPVWFTAFKQEQLLKTQALEQKFSDAQKKDATELLLKSAKTEFYKKYKISEVEKPLFDKAVAIEMQLNPNHDNVDTLVNGFKTQYEDLRSSVGLGSIVPVAANDGGGGSKKTPILDSLKKDLQAQGKLPTPQTN